MLHPLHTHTLTPTSAYFHIAAVRAQRLLMRDGESRALTRTSTGSPHGPLLQNGDRLIISCLAEAVPVLREVPGLRLRPDAPYVQLTPPGCHTSLVFVEVGARHESNRAALVAAPCSQNVLKGAPRNASSASLSRSPPCLRRHPLRPALLSSV